jgi:hypothetical protein
VRLKVQADVSILQRLSRVLAARSDEVIGPAFVLFRGYGRQPRPTNTDHVPTQPMPVIRTAAARVRSDSRPA